MGLINCREGCHYKDKEKEGNLDVIDYNESSDNNKIKKANSRDCNSNYSESKNNDEQYLKFKKTFEEKLPSIGRYISNFDFDNLVPDDARKYITENILDISKYLSLNAKTYEIKPIEFLGGNVYKGSWNDKNEMEGYGQYYLKGDKVLAEGVWKEGCLIFARVFLPNGDLYEGGFQNSIFNGQGKLSKKNGEIYEGNFVNGEKTGICTYLFPDGTIYNGKIVNGLFNGEGNMKWNNGLEYKGNFLNSTLQGFGILTNLDGEKYEGYFDNNIFNGSGKLYYDNGDIYDGNFELGKKFGKGIYMRNDGIIFECEWYDDKPHGYGKIHDGENVFKCSFRNGEIIEFVILKGGQNYQYNLLTEFKPEETNLGRSILLHLKYKNNNVSANKFEPGITPSFLED